MSPAPARLPAPPGVGPPRAAMPAAGPSAADAMAAVLDGLGSLARLRAAELPAASQADLLRELERAESMLVAARSAVLHAFSAGGGYADDGQHSAKGWLTWQARVTRGAAAGAAGWVKRLAAHPAVDQALAAGEISASWARRVCELSNRMPEDRRDTADEILLAAAASADVTLADLHGLAEEMFRRCAPPDGDGTGDPAARSVHLDTHFRGAGKLDGDLTPQCAEALGAVLESLGKRRGAEDQRTRPERMHDALEEACRRLIAAGGLPDRAGQPTQIQLHLTLGNFQDQIRRATSSSHSQLNIAKSNNCSPHGDGLLCPVPAVAAGSDPDFSLTHRAVGAVSRLPRAGPSASVRPPRARLRA